MISRQVTRTFFQRHGVAVALFALLIVYGVEAHVRRHVLAPPATLGDQGAYLGYARQMYQTHYSVVGDRNRMPIYPGLLSLMYRPGLSEEEFLRRAQIFNVNLSVVLLLLLFLVFQRFFPAKHALAMTSATAFGVFLYRAVNVQVEVLYYFISFCSFLLLLRMLVAPGWLLAVASGATVGLAYLTKASALPALWIWVLIFILQTGRQCQVQTGRRIQDLGHRIGLLLMVLVAFGCVTFSYLRQSEAIHGRYFFNVNSSFVMWCDSAPEGLRFLELYARDNGKSLSPAQIPSPAKYWREHSFGQIASRLAKGLWDLAHLKAQLIGYYKFVMLMLVATVLCWFRWPQTTRELLAENLFPAMFCVSFVMVYLLLYAWYGAIVKDSRFVLSIFLPFMFAASLVTTSIGRRRINMGVRQIELRSIVSGALLGLALIDIAYNGSQLFAIHV